METATLDPPAKSASQVEIYQLHFLLLDISPAIWRRVLVRSDSTIADLHYLIQMTLGWTDSHLHQFSLHARTYGVSQPGGSCFDDDPKAVELSDPKLRLKECFSYQYDFGDNWRLQIRLEQILPASPRKVYPFCVAGARLVPQEDCGGPVGFLELEVELKAALWEAKMRLIEVMSSFLADLDKPGLSERVVANRAEISQLLAQIKAATFDREAVNARLQLYTSGDSRWLEGFQ